MITIIVGGQFGGEGKGKVEAHLCRDCKYDIAVKCGGPNSGHTVTWNGEKIVLRQIPVGVVNQGTIVMMAAGCLIDPVVLQDEINLFKLTRERLRIDRNAMIIEDADKSAEWSMKMRDKIGSTCSGTGWAVSRRVLRDSGVKLARDIPSLQNYIDDVAERIYKQNENYHSKIVIEGTQGYGLSLYHTPYYPYATSRDTTAAAFASEVGIGPRMVNEVIMVVRAFPIRVGGNSGELPLEIRWEVVQMIAGFEEDISEFTSVTNRLRRVARIDYGLVKRAYHANSPTKIALMGIDHINAKDRSARSFNMLSDRSRKFVRTFESEIGSVWLVGTGPADSDLFVRDVDNLYI